MSPLVASALVLVSLCAAVSDARTGRIPNALTLPAALGAVLLHGVFGGWVALGVSVAGLIGAGAVPWLLHRATRGQAIGGGDVKLFTALGAIGGPVVGLEIELSAFLLLGVFALIQLAFRGRLLRVLGNVLCLVANPILPSGWRRTIEPEALTAMRLGPAIALAAGVVLLRDQVARWLPWLG